MGGNALSSGSVRLTKSNYKRLSDECVAKLRVCFPGKRIEALGSYRNKESFGDCDILVESSVDYDPFKAAQELGAVEVVRNGPVTSIGVIVRPEIPNVEGNVFQVDLIKTDSDAFDFSLNYFGRGDAGNLLGRLFHSAGLSLRHDGLVYYFRDGTSGDYKFREIMLTRNFEEALLFMEYDPIPYKNGFDNPEDIYRYVASSPFFNSSIFLLENRNAKSRVRDRKRPMYMHFLEFCENSKDLPCYEYPEDKSTWLPRIFEFFPNFKAEFDKAAFDLEENHFIKSKFNGEWVSQLTGLQGKELGMLMKRFKESFESSEQQRAFLLNNPFEVIESRVKELSCQVNSELTLKLKKP